MTTQPTFRKYSSIDNHNKAGYLGYLRDHGLDGGEWVVQEKAHGANLSFTSLDGLHWVTGKRTSLLAPDEAFYGHHSLLERHRDGLAGLWQVLRKRYPDGDGQVTVYGELVGGAYPGVSSDGYKRVQKGVHYAPDHQFYAFDIWVHGVGYLGVDEANALFGAAGLAFAKTRFRGSLTECLAQPNDFDSEIPLQFGLAPVSPNLVEGVVIRPVDVRHVPSGSRVLIKHKNERWSDKIRKPRVRQPAVAPEPEVQALLDAALEYATPARVPAAVSKVGEVTRRQFGQLVGMTAQDMHADFLGEHERAFLNLAQAEQKLITKALAREATNLVKQYFADVGT